MTTHRTPGRLLLQAFPGISPEEVEMLISSARIGKYAAGTVVCMEGALEKTFYIILEGEVQVTKKISANDERIMSVLRAGDFFGEMALVHNTRRSATVQALTDVIFMEIDRDAFDRVLKNSNAIALAMVRKISERLRENDEMAIEDLRLRASELAQAYQKLSEEELARREFLERVAHELKTPLSATMGYLHLLAEGMVDPDAAAEAARLARQHIQNIADLVNDILFMQELDLVLPSFQPVDMRELVRTVADGLQEKAAAKHIKLKVKMPLRLPQVSGDEASLRRALSALISNIIELNYPHSKIVVSMTSDNAHVHVRFKTDGFTIGADELPNLFEKFYMPVSENGDVPGGLGIGLAIARQVVAQHQGELTAEKVSGQDTVFLMTLPVRA